jgi:hypothetical protein
VQERSSGSALSGYNDTYTIVYKSLSGGRFADVLKLVHFVGNDGLASGDDLNIEESWSVNGRDTDIAEYNKAVTETLGNVELKKIAPSADAVNSVLTQLQNGGR